MVPLTSIIVELLPSRKLLQIAETEWQAVPGIQQQVATLYVQDLAAGASIRVSDVELLSVGAHPEADAVVSVNLHWPHSDPELVESYQAWLAAGTSVERFPRLAAASLYVVNHTFGSLQDPTLLPGARPTVQLDVLLEFPDVDVVTLPEVSHGGPILISEHCRAICAAVRMGGTHVLLCRCTLPNTYAYPNPLLCL